MSLNASTAAPSGHFFVGRKKPAVIAQTHLTSVSLSKTENFHIKTTVVDVEDPRLLNSLL